MPQLVRVRVRVRVRVGVGVGIRVGVTVRVRARAKGSGRDVSRGSAYGRRRARHTCGAGRVRVEYLACDTRGCNLECMTTGLQPSANGVAGLVAASLAGTGAMGSGVLPAAAWQLAGS